MRAPSASPGSNLSPSLFYADHWLLAKEGNRALCLRIPVGLPEITDTSGRLIAPSFAFLVQEGGTKNKQDITHFKVGT